MLAAPTRVSTFWTSRPPVTGVPCFVLAPASATIDTTLADEGETHYHMGGKPMKANTPSRRGFLRGTGLVAMGLATGGTIILAPDCTWALSTTAIDVHTAQTLLVMARQLFPHDRLGDQYYASVVDALDKQAAGDPALRKLLADGV